jgi:hypothetical protein
MGMFIREAVVLRRMRRPCRQRCLVAKLKGSIAYLRACGTFLEDQAREWRADGEELMQEEGPNDACSAAWTVTNRRAVDSSIRNKVLREFATGTFPPEDSAEYQALLRSSSR